MSVSLDSLGIKLSGDVTSPGNSFYYGTNGTGVKGWYVSTSGGGLTIGTSTITSGTSGRVLYDNAGVVGEMTTTGSGTVLALSTSPAFTTPSLGVATATSINGNIFTTGSSTYTGTAAQTYTFPTTNASIARTDAGQTFLGAQVFSGGIDSSGANQTNKLGVWNFYGPNSNFNATYFSVNGSTSSLTNTWQNILGIGTVSTASTSSTSGTVFTAPTATAPTSGTYGAIVTTNTKGPIITTGVGSITNAAAAYFEAGSGATNNYAIWSQTGTNRLDGKTSIGGVTTPTALLHLMAGTTTANTAPLKLTSGVNLATTEAGAIEYDGTHLYFTVTNGGTRYQIDQQPGSGVTSLSAIGSTPNANAATITGSVLNLQPADATFGGIITALPQSIVGAKTFTTSVDTPTLNCSQTFTVSGNAWISVGLGLSRNSILLQGNSTAMRNGSISTNSWSLNASESYSQLLIGSSPISTAATGTIALISQLAIKPTPITLAGGSITNAATLYIEGASTGAVITNNYALWVASGLVRLESDLNVIGNTTTGSTQFFATNTTSVTAGLMFQSSASGIYTNKFGGYGMPGIGSTNVAIVSTIFSTTSFYNPTAGNTSPLYAQVGIKPYTLTGAGTGTVTNSASLYIEGAATGATNNYSLWIAGGGFRFDSALLPNNLAGTLGQVLTSAGAGAVPTWSTVSGSGITISINNISTTTTGAATVTVNYVYLCTTTFTYTQPTAVSNTNRYTIKNSGTGVITVLFTSGQTGDGSSTITLRANSSIDLISNNTNWIIV